MKKITTMLSVLVFITSQLFGSGPVWLDQLDLGKMEVEFGQSVSGKTPDGTVLTIGNKTFERGVSTMPVSKFLIDLKGFGEKFTAEVGIDQCSGDNSEAEFIVMGDRSILWRSGMMKKGDSSKLIEVNLKGIKKLALLVNRGSRKGNGGPGGMPPAGGMGPGAGAPPAGEANKPRPRPGMTVADWCNAKIEYTGEVSPEAIDNTLKTDTGKMILTPASPKSPLINGAKVIGCTPGKDFVFTVAVSGERPLTVSAKGLPATLKIDKTTGIISGTSPAKGEYKIGVEAKNKYGSVREEIKIISGDNLALTPPMGWNSWNAFGTAVDQDKVKGAAETMAEKLRDYGWSYVNIDDGWEAKERTPDGELNGNEKFPDMKALGEYIHSKGLKFGIYSSPGTTTCGGNLASYQHEAQDAGTWAKWGVDFLKYDWCSYRGIAKDNSLEELEKPYQEMNEALRSTNRDIVYSLCQYGMGDVWKWGAEVGGNLWRTSGDIQDSWSSLKRTGFNQTANADYANPGHWNDPDMLVVGEVGGWGSNIHYTKLTPDEQYTHISLWSLMSSPLFIGCNLKKLDPFTLNLLTNREVIAIDQDPLGKQAKPLIKTDEFQVWAREIEGGAEAVGVFFTGKENNDPAELFYWGDSQDMKTMKITVKLSDLGLSGKYMVRDVWRQKDLGICKDAFETEVNYHGVALLKLTKVK